MLMLLARLAGTPPARANMAAGRPAGWGALLLATPHQSVPSLSLVVVHQGLLLLLYWDRTAPCQSLSCWEGSCLGCWGYLDFWGTKWSTGLYSRLGSCTLYYWTKVSYAQTDKLKPNPSQVLEVHL